ncbi:MAG: hydantoinase B/oxoprolinase family protein, partial [Alphaproteobacteria bacterium]|nr:hydantoinase B/oxoprolinase family protein [Alphaproteobacteria bacterium]
MTYRPAGAEGKWRFAIDRGGTFTDVIGQAPDGSVRRCKLLSEGGGLYADPAVEGMRRLIGLPAGAPVPPGRVAELRLGTTVATNALLERRGARTAFVTTRGFADALRIGTQARPDIFALAIVRPPPLFESVLEVDERVEAGGRVRAVPDPGRVRAGLDALRADGLEACAIAFLHGYRYPAHERTVAALAREAGFEHVVASHEVSARARFLPRAETALADAYLAPVLGAYLGRLVAALGWPAEAAEEKLLFMRSDGGLARLAAFRGKDAVLSGPAGGVVGLARAGAEAGIGAQIGFDMGGTSTDVARHAGRFERQSGRAVAGVRLAVPMLDIHTVAAGGGSIVRFDGERLRVGPESAGADPGPAAYGRGGPPTLTDANLLLGRLQPDDFPPVFGPEGRAPIDMDAVRAAFGRLSAAMGGTLGPEAVAEGALAIGIETMAEAIRAISIQKGHALREHALNCFGGAGGQHATGLAAHLGMEKVLVHPNASLLSAFGIALADRSVLRERTVSLPLGVAGLAEAGRVAEGLAEEALEELGPGAGPDAAPRREVTLLLRMEGNDTLVPLAPGAPEAMEAAFADAHRARFGYGEADGGLVIDTVRVEVILPGPTPPSGEPEAPPVRAADRVRLHLSGRWIEAPRLAVAALGPGETLTGPALLTEPYSTILLDPGWQAVKREGGILLLTRTDEGGTGAPPPSEDPGGAVDPVELELFNRRFMAIADQMGVALESSASSVNIRERLDFSCALFDADGALIANAPHIPVHLGSMGSAVRAVAAAWEGRLGPGDVIATNDPFGGGTHLPDVTAVMPVFLPGEGAPRFWVAARGHHADIGGLTPGSMPAGSTRLAEEGVVLSALKVVQGGCLATEEISRALAAGPHPARTPSRNLADLRAQIAACRRGAEALADLCAAHGPARVTAFMGHVLDNGEAAVRRTLASLDGGETVYPLEGGGQIAVRVSVDRQARRARVDFTGTSAEVAGNRNAPLAISRAAVLYVFRCLVGDDIPLNDGCLRPLDIVVPEGSLLNPRPGAGVVAGNVETSQAVTNALFLALGVLAAGQGTMNNLTFGDGEIQYYETLCGGAGAGPGHDGADAVHTHMTNSRLT